MDSGSRKSRQTAMEYRSTLAFSKAALASAVIFGSFGSTAYEYSPLIYIVLCLACVWAAVCHQVEGFIYRKVINPAIEGLIFTAVIIFSPMALLLLASIMFGISIYFLLLLTILSNPSLKLTSGNRFYTFRHPLSAFIPITYLAPKPLSKIFEPVVTFHWGVGIFNLPVWRVSVFDPVSLHDYIKTRGEILGEGCNGWSDALDRFRQAIGLINLLDALHRIESIDLDGVALAASARLALSKIPETARYLLMEGLSTFKPDKQNTILSAFDILPEHI